MKALLAITSVLMSQTAVLAAANAWIAPPSRTAAGYPVPHPDVAPVLPGAHAAHPEYAIEWWYWVGHLRAVESGHEYGFQSTVFRLAGDPDQQKGSDPETPFSDHQLYMSHAALSNLSEASYTHVERIHRAGWQASASSQRLDLRAGPIHARQQDNEQIEMRLSLPDATTLDLVLQPKKPLVAFGERGLSRKGADLTAVSWYWTYPRLEVTGVLQQGDRRTELEGIAWMDHEISSSQLGGDLEGWDWTAIQLDDGTEVKAYRLRRKGGEMDPWSACYWIDADGQTRHVYADKFQWIEAGSWKSEATGITYPNEVRIEAIDPDSGQRRIYRLRPRFDAQEFRGLRTNNPYWEGACKVLDAEGRPVGRAYLELAGYGGGLGRQLRAE